MAELFVQKYNKKFYYLFETDQWIFFDEQWGWIVEKQDEYKNSWWQNLVFQLASQAKPLQIQDSEKWIRARRGCVNKYSTHASMMAVFKILKNRLDVRQASGVFDGEPHLLGV